MATQYVTTHTTQGLVGGLGSTAVLFFISSILGLFIGIKASITDANKESFGYGISMLSLSTFLMLAVWIYGHYSEGAEAFSVWKIALSACAVAIAGMGWGGLLGYKGALDEDTTAKKQWNIALILTPMATLLLGVYLYYLGTGHVIHYGLNLFIHIVIGIFFVAAGSLFIKNKDHLNSSTDTGFFWWYVISQMVAGVLMILISIGHGAGSVYMGKSIDALTGGRGGYYNAPAAQASADQASFML